MSAQVLQYFKTDKLWCTHWVNASNAQPIIPSPLVFYKLMLIYMALPSAQVAVNHQWKVDDYILRRSELYKLKTVMEIRLRG